MSVWYNECLIEWVKPSKKIILDNFSGSGFEIEAVRYSAETG